MAGALAPLVFSTLLLASVLSAPVRGDTPAFTSNLPPVETVQGAGPGEEKIQRLGCVACTIAIIGASGGTVLGFVINVVFFPGSVATCGALCYLAFR